MKPAIRGTQIPDIARMPYQFCIYHGGRRDRIHSVTQVKTRVGWLVVCVVLPGNGYSVLWIMHQSLNAISGGISCGVYPKIFIIGSSPDHFLTPVSKYICLKAWISFGIISRICSISGQEVYCS